MCLSEDIFTTERMYGGEFRRNECTVVETWRNECTVVKIRRNECTVAKIRRNECKVSRIRCSECTVATIRCSKWTVVRIWWSESTVSRIRWNQCRNQRSMAIIRLRIYDGLNLRWWGDGGTIIRCTASTMVRIRWNQCTIASIRWTASTMVWIRWNQCTIVRTQHSYQTIAIVPSLHRIVIIMLLILWWQSYNLTGRTRRCSLHKLQLCSTFHIFDDTYIVMTYMCALLVLTSKDI